MRDHKLEYICKIYARQNNVSKDTHIHIFKTAYLRNAKTLIYPCFKDALLVKQGALGI